MDAGKRKPPARLTLKMPSTYAGGPRPAHPRRQRNGKQRYWQWRIIYPHVIYLVSEVIGAGCNQPVPGAGADSAGNTFER